MLCTIYSTAALYLPSCQVPRTHAEVYHLSTASCTYCQRRLCRRDGLSFSQECDSSSSTTSLLVLLLLLLCAAAAATPAAALLQKQQQEQHRSRRHVSLQYPPRLLRVQDALRVLYQPVYAHFLHWYEILNHDYRQYSQYITRDGASMSSIKHPIPDTWYLISIGSTEQPDNRKVHC